MRDINNPLSLTARSKGRELLLLIIALFFVSIAPSQAAPPDETRRFDDWLLKCTPDQRSCLISQLISKADSNDQVLAVAVGYNRGHSQPTIAFNLPPQINPAKGLTFTIDDHRTLDLPIDDCKPERCTAQANLRDEILEQLRGGKAAMITYMVASSGQRVGVKLSLVGFDAAFKALTELPHG